MFGNIYQTGAQIAHRAYEWGSETVQAVSERLPEAVKNNAVTRFAGSVLGRMFFRMQAENIAECSGYFGSVYLLAPVSSQIGSGITRLFIARTAPFWSRIAGSAVSTQIMYNYFTYRRLNSLTLSLAQIFFLISTFLASDAALALKNPEAIESHLESYEESLGNTIIEYGIGLFVAFAFMKCTNTPEVFWDSQNITGSYSFKTIQAMASCDLLGKMGYMPSHPMVRTATGLAVGSFIYNLQDIIQLLSSTAQGKLLDGALSKEIESILPPELQEHIHQEPANEFPIENREIVARRAVHLLTKTANLYFHLLAKNPAFFEEVTQVWDHDYARLSTKERRRAMFEQLQRDEEIKQHLTNDLEGPSLVLSAFGCAPLLHEITPAVNRETIQAIARSLLEYMESQEERLVGSSLASEAQRAAQIQILENHIEKICALIPLLFSSFGKDLEDAEIRQFYIHLSQLAEENYAPIIGKTAARIGQKLLERQLQYSTFSQN